MKKIFLLIALTLMMTGLFLGQASQSTTFNLSLYLNEYIETMPGPVEVKLPHTSHAYDGEIYGNSLMDPWDLAYANCPFRVTISGDNPAGEGKPRFARLETGTHANGYDVLSAYYELSFTINGESPTARLMANAFPHTWEYVEAPHNGQLKMHMSIWINWPGMGDSVPMRKTLITPAFTWQQSADAGIYSCSMTVTIGAL